MNKLRCLFQFLSILFLIVVSVSANGGLAARPPRGAPMVHHVHKLYEVGQPLRFECKDAEGQWAAGPVCTETGQELTFVYGVDTVVSCGFSLASPEDYAHMQQLISREASWECRLRMLPDVDFYVPCFIPIWGVVERDHLHVDNHMNFVFHAFAGKILGVAIYPVRDQFQLAAPGGSVVVHGPAKWFKGGSFDAFSSVAPRPEAIADHHSTSILILVVLWSIISFLVTAIVFLFVYKFFLRPRLIEKVLKAKKE